MRFITFEEYDMDLDKVVLVTPVFEDVMTTDYDYYFQIFFLGVEQPIRFTSNNKNDLSKFRSGFVGKLYSL